MDKSLLLKAVIDKECMDKEIIKYLDTHITERIALESKVRALEFHKAVLLLIEQEKENGILSEYSSMTADDIFFLLKLGAISVKQSK